MSLPIEIDCQTVHQRIQAGDGFLLLDCREPEEWETARIDAARLIPMSELPQRIDELEPHREQQIIVHCHHGSRSLRVTLWLRQQGYASVQNMAGGIDAWSLTVDPSVPRY